MPAPPNRSLVILKRHRTFVCIPKWKLVDGLGRTWRELTGEGDSDPKRHSLWDHSGVILIKLFQSCLNPCRYWVFLISVICDCSRR
jgi:hypothetical protein